jgi:L-alanine-DL-glutamate epimerase-like enolase superfamily enzyme
LRIVAVRTHVLLDPGFEADATSSAQDDLIVELITDEGLVGIGESDINAWVGRACIEAPGTHTMDVGLGAALIGLDPVGDPEATWDRLYQGTAMTGRRGALIHALGAIDIALWDLRGKAAGLPVWQLLGEPAQPPAAPYASLLPQERTFDKLLESFIDQAVKAHALGFKAAKLELNICGPYASTGLDEPDARMVEIIRAVRQAVGPSFDIMVDVAYAWDSAAHAQAVIETWADQNIYFVETPLQSDDIDGYAELARTSPIPIAAGEWLATRHEFRELIDARAVNILQPDVGRVGGLTEAMRVSRIADASGLRIIPHAWKTGITLAATAHLAQITPGMPYFECLPRELTSSALRRELLKTGPDMAGGQIVMPDAPGLGIELDHDAMQRFEAAADQAHSPCR